MRRPQQFQNGILGILKFAVAKLNPPLRTTAAGSAKPDRPALVRAGQAAAMSSVDSEEILESEASEAANNCPLAAAGLNASVSPSRSGHT